MMKYFHALKRLHTFGACKLTNIKGYVTQVMYINIKVTYDCYEGHLNNMYTLA